MRWLADILICLRFFSRLPVPASEREIALGRAGLSEALALAPLAGFAIGLCAALVLGIAVAIGLPVAVVAILAIATLVVVTGALHEDALADCADGFGGGGDPATKLEIMSDSRIGAFGTCALVLSLLMRVATLAEIVDRAPGAAALIVIGASSLSRGLCLLPIALLPPARAIGAGASTQAQPARVRVAVGIGMGVLVLTGIAIGRPLAALLAALLALGGAIGVTAFARRQIGGQTGDVAGAAQQVAEMIVLAVFSAAL